MATVNQTDLQIQRRGGFFLALNVIYCGALAWIYLTRFDDVGVLWAILLDELNSGIGFEWTHVGLPFIQAIINISLLFTLYLFGSKSRLFIQSVLIVSSIIGMVVAVYFNSGRIENSVVLAISIIACIALTGHASPVQNGETTGSG